MSFQLLGDQGLIAASTGEPGSLISRLDDLLVPHSGDYTLLVTAGAGTTYAVTVTSNAQLEREPNDGPPPSSSPLSATHEVLGHLIGEQLPPAPLAFEIEPNDAQIPGQYIVVDIPFANDISGSFFQTGADTFDLVLNGVLDADNGSQILRDVYKFYASPGDTINLQVRFDASVAYGAGLYDFNGDLLISGTGGSSTQTWIQYSNFPYEGEYFISVDGFGAPVGYVIDGTMTDPDPFSFRNDDFFTFTAAGGEQLVLSTATPGALLNGLDPALALFDSTGILIAEDDDSAADGRNALLELTIPAPGQYTARIRAEPTTAGEYLLNFTGLPPSPLPPFTVTSTTPSNGDAFETAPTHLTMDFSHAVRFDTLTASDLTVNDTTAVAVTAIDGDTVKFTLPPLVGGIYQVSLAAEAATNLQGVPVELFAATFSVGVTDFPLPLIPIEPLGSLVYRGLADGEIASAIDTNIYRIDLDHPQLLSATVRPDAGLRPSLDILDAQQHVIASMTASDVGQAAAVEHLAIDATGALAIRISGADASTGAFELDVVLNAARESEIQHQPSNNTRGSAQPISDGWLTTSSGIERLAVVGSLTEHEAVVESEDFESLSVGPEWDIAPYTQGGRTRIIADHGAAEGDMALLMDVDPAWVGSIPQWAKLNEAVWTVDLAGLTAAELSFAHAVWNEGDDGGFGSGPFTGHPFADGILFSSDGTEWWPIFENSAPQPAGEWQYHSVDLSAAVSDAGLVLGDNFNIKFQQVGEYDIPINGRGWDDISITTLVADEDWYEVSLEATERYSFLLKSSGPATQLNTTAQSLFQLWTGLP